ncbi:MAG: hypothetical protein QM495_01870 [Lutibacter sp.]|uniref:hypothetical protein n=1 Tax=Lutibacter sp. TaxID=1925666 RepID=UPI00385F5CF3
MEENKKSNSKIIVIVLAVLLLAVVAYTFYNNTEHKKLTDAIEEEKMEIEGNLDNMIVKYEEAIGQNTSLSSELSIERDRIVALRDSIKGLKATNYSLIRRYRKQIAKLEETNRRLFFMTDSLTGVNQLLTIDLDSANVKISSQLAKNDTLTSQNLSLSEKVAIGSVLKVNKAKVLAMRERNNGKLVETSRAKNTDAFRINFTIAKNEISEQGERQVYIQIVNSKGLTVASKGELTINDTQVSYSDQTIVNYLNEAVDIISLVEVNRDYVEKGLHTVNIYIENKFVGATNITLK